MTDRYENIRKALEMGPTPGPWKVDPENTPPRSIDSAAGGAVLYGCGCCGSPNMSVEDATHIAACDPDTIRALLAERDALARDAERYRWLREDAGDTADGPYIAGAHGEPFAGDGWLTGEHADTAIDAAIAAANGGGNG